MDPDETGSETPTGPAATPAADVLARLADVVPVPLPVITPPGLEIARELAGGPRNDVIVGGPQNNVIEGLLGDDTLVGGDGDNVLIGGPGNDTLVGGRGDNAARFSGSVFEYDIVRGNREVTVRHARPEGGRNDGADRAIGIQRLEFLDRKVFLDGTNNAPVARHDTGFTVEDGNTLRIPIARLLANDREFDGDQLSVSSLPKPQARGLARIEGGTIVYEPPNGFQWALAEGDSYADTFAYTVSDGKGGTAIATAKITVTRPRDPRNYPTGPATRNDRPAGPGDISSLWDATATPAILTDPDTAAVELGVKFQANVDGAITGLRFYKGPNNTGAHVGNLWTASGANLATATFTNETTSGWQQVAFAAPVPITAGATYVASYHAPNGQYSVNEDYFTQAYTNGPLTAPADGTVGGNGVYRYGATSTFPTQTFRASNYWVDVVFQEAIPNTPPVASDDPGDGGSFPTDEDTALRLAPAALLANDSDADGDPLTIASVSNAINGAVTLDGATGEVVFTPNANYFGPTSFTYTISDGKGGSATATVSVAVAAVNDPPTAIDDSAATAQGAPVVVAVLANDTDPDGDTLSIDSFTQGANGTVTNNGDGTLTYSPAAGFTGSDSFTYTASDGIATSNPATVGITVTAAGNTPPTAIDDSAATAQGAPVVVAVLANDTDPDGDTLSIDSFTQGANGTVTNNGDGTLTYSPAAGFTGSDSFTYTASDGIATSNPATVGITVTAAGNTPPTAIDDSATTNENTAVTINVLANDTDPDGDTLTVTALDVTGTQGQARLNANNTVTYDPAGAFQSLTAGQTATDSFAYIVSDGRGGSAAATVTVTITGLDDVVNPIIAENQKVGNPQSEWGINGPSSTIEGFATNISANRGETVDFKVRTAARDYRLDIYRLGYYGGAGARKVATVQPSAPLPQNQPAPLTDSATGLVDAGNWSVSASWAVPADAVSGVYIAKLVREDGTFGENHIPFIVRDDNGGSDLLFQTSDSTWHAYNLWSGKNFYTSPRAYKLSYNTPFNGATTSPNVPIFDAEYPMLRWLEANGYNVSYTTDVDTDRRGQELLEHKVFLSVGHDEYWSGQQRANVEAARAAGVNLAFFGANDIYWKTRWENSIDGSGTPHRTLVSYKETWGDAGFGGGTAAKIDPNPAWTGTWRDPRFSPPSDGGRPENELIGTLFQVDSYRLDNMKVPAADGKMRFWRNTSIANQSPGQVATLTPNVLGYEWNEDLDNGFRPEGSIRLSNTTLDVPAYLLDYGNTTGPGTARHNMTLFRDPQSGALTFSAGTTRWSWGLDSNHINESSTADPRMQQATVNLFADMGVQPGTLQSGLVAATPSSDTTRPTSSIASPAGGSSTTVGSTVTISGTASDTGGRVGGVEVSVDGGSTWHPANGRENWSYNWTPQTEGTVTVTSRAIDDSLNIQSPGSSVNFTVNPQPGPWSIWSASATPAIASVNDPNAVELGVKFQPNIDGYVTGLRFYKGSQNTGTHVGNLWTATGAKLATATFTNETATGWQQVNFANPVAVTANTTYVASYHAPSGNYAANNDYFATSGVNSGRLRALASPDSGGNGVYAYGAGSFPTNSFRSTNYWVDVVFTDSLAA